MVLNAYSIYDRKALTFSPPFFAVTDGLAARMVYDSMGPNSSLSRHPADYVLYRVGAFNDSNGHLDTLDPVAHVCDVVTLLPTHTQTDLFKTDAATTVEQLNQAFSK